MPGNFIEALQLTEGDSVDDTLGAATTTVIPTEVVGPHAGAEAAPARFVRVYCSVEGYVKPRSADVDIAVGEGAMVGAGETIILNCAGATRIAHIKSAAAAAGLINITPLANQ